MPEESINSLDPKDGETIVDATAGEGGHSYRLLKRYPHIKVIALDADPRAVATASARLAEFGDRAQVVQSNFSEIEHALKKLRVEKVDKVLFDLGWNSGQLASGRGFSFLHDEPLNMSYGDTPASGFTAAEIVNEWDESTLADVFYGYGEERYSRRIAKAIVERRAEQPFTSTIELVEVIRDAVPAAYRKGRIHPATRTFQALRIAVNDELTVIERGIAGAWNVLADGGRIAIITFHSIEDRVVKRAFSALAKGGGGKLVEKKPVPPSRKETITNARARSAKLRIIEKLCNQ